MSDASETEFWMIFFLISIGPIYLWYSIRVTRSIRKRNYITNQQKKWNIILVWCIPFLWFYLIDKLIHPNQNVMTKKTRKKLLRFKRGDNGADSTQGDMYEGL